MEVRELAALLEDPRLVVIDHVQCLRATFNPHSGSSNTLLGQPSRTYKHTHTYTHTYKHTLKKSLVIGHNCAASFPSVGFA